MNDSQHGRLDRGQSAQRGAAAELGGRGHDVLARARRAMRREAVGVVCDV